jgi:hypothetical protein
MARIGLRWADSFSKTRFAAGRSRIAKCAASKNAHARYALPFFTLPSPFILSLPVFLLSTQEAKCPSNHRSDAIYGEKHLVGCSRFQGFQHGAVDSIDPGIEQPDGGAMRIDAELVAGIGQMRARALSSRPVITVLGSFIAVCRHNALWADSTCVVQECSKAYKYRLRPHFLPQKAFTGRHD